MPNGRINVILRPGDAIPEDCTILRAFDDPRQWNAHVITVEAEWLDYGQGYDDLTILEYVTMKELHARKMAWHLGPLEAVVNG